MLYILYATIGTILLAYAAEYLISLRDDSREPLRLHTKLPLVGHVVGFLKSGPSYHNLLK
jgi:hypothetical protein